MSQDSHLWDDAVVSLGDLYDNLRMRQSVDLYLSRHHSTFSLSSRFQARLQAWTWKTVCIFPTRRLLELV